MDHKLKPKETKRPTRKISRGKLDMNLRLEALNISEMLPGLVWTGKSKRKGGIVPVKRRAESLTVSLIPGHGLNICSIRSTSSQS